MRAETSDLMPFKDQPAPLHPMGGNRQGKSQPVLVAQGGVLLHPFTQTNLKDRAGPLLLYEGAICRVM